MTALITEFCQNHNGDYDTLARMVEAAAANGATHGKMQTILADELAFRPQFEDGLEQNGETRSIKRPYGVEYERLKGLEISEQDTGRFIQACRDNGLVPMTTCFTRAQIDGLRQLGFKSIKVASYDCASFPMLRELARAFDELIVSTGATFDDEIRHAADILRGKNFSFLHCVTIYPTPLEDVHLARMEFLRGLAPVVGFSDHSLVARDGLVAAKAALALGAEMIERHFTILDADQTRDGPVSIRPEHLKELADFAALALPERVSRLDGESPDWRKTVGEKSRRLSDAELLNRDYYRGRFANRRPETVQGTRMIFNWEEGPLP